MRPFIILIVLLWCCRETCAQSFDYPDTRRVEHVDHYHGTAVSDPYRWLEEMRADETLQWARSQDNLFCDYAKSASNRDWILKRITAVRDFDFLGTPTKVGDLYFQLRGAAGQSSSILSVSRNPTKDGRVFFDPNTDLDEEHQWRGWSISPDARLLVYGVTTPESLLTQLRFMDIVTSELLSDRIEGIQGSARVAWLPDSSGFFYRQFEIAGDKNKPEVVNPVIKFHKLGSSQDDDTVVFRPEKSTKDTFMWGPSQSSDRRFLVFSFGERTVRKSQYFVLDLQNQEAGPRKLFDVEDPRFTFLDAHDGRLFFDTVIDAPRGRVISVDPNNAEREHWQELIPESEDALLGIAPAGDFLIGQYLRDAIWKLRVFDLSGKFLREADLPSIGGAGFASKLGEDEVFFSFGNLIDPNSVFRFDPTSGESELVRRTELGFDPQAYTMRQVFYTNPQGKKVSMFLAHRKDLEQTGDAPVWLYGFGHGRWAALPWFQPHWVTWLDMGGIFAVPAMRGGGEYGDEWYEQGIRRNKQNAIDDFIASAEWLVDQGYTRAGRIVAYSGSAGGPVPAAAIIQRPELFGACVIDNPFLDMLRYPEYAYGFTTGYGSPEDPDDFKALHAYSPYHNVTNDQVYPPTLISIAENDTSTVPMHGYKFVAALQHHQNNANPMMLQMIWNAGHYTYGATKQERIENQANQLAFLSRVLGLTTKQ